MARTPIVRCTKPMTETRQPSVLNGSIQMTSVTPSYLRLCGLKITAKHACYQCNKNNNTLYKKTEIYYVLKKSAFPVRNF